MIVTGERKIQRYARAKGSGDKWIVTLAPGMPRSRMRLFCIPYAGGGASVFSAWSASLSPEVQVCSVQLPGRENRLAEDPLTDMEVVVDLMGKAIEPWLDQPFAIFGHSNGAVMGFELARWLRRRNLPGPCQLFVAGSAAPHIPDQKAPIHRLPEPDFLREIGKMEGTPAEVLANPHIMELLSPMLRADMAIHETYRFVEEEPLQCPIFSFGGIDDKEVSPSDSEAWKMHTSGVFKARLFAGNHFFLRTSKEMLECLRQEIQFLL